jgi:RNA polymerase sigma factor (sigma-70 family)
VRDRDEAAFAAIIDRHGPMVLGVARRVLRDPHAADDIFQATFLALARSAAALGRPGALPAWLHRTAVRAAVKLARLHRPTTLAADPPAAPADPLDALTARELLAAVDDEIRRLPAALRAAVVACGLEGQSQDEAARLLGWTPGQVRGRLERGRRRLERGLARRGLVPAAGGVLLFATMPVVSAGLRDAAIGVATGRAEAPRAVAALAASAGRRLPVRAAVSLVLGLAAVGLAGLAPGRLPRAAESAPIPPAAVSGEVPLPDGAVRRFGTARLRVGDGPIAVTPDGKSVVVVSPEGVVRVLDAGTGRVTAEHVLPMSAMAFYAGRRVVLSADGSTAVTHVWNADATGNTLTAWDLGARRPLWTMTATNGGTGDYVALSADGKRLVVVEPSADWKRAAVKAVDLGTGRSRAVADMPVSVRRIHLSPDGKRALLVTGGEDGQTWVCIDIDTGARLWGTPALWRTVSFSPDGGTLAVEVGYRLRILDARTGEPVGGLKLPEQIFELDPSPVLSPDGRTVFVGDSKMRGYIVWDYRAGKKVGVVPAWSFEGGFPHRGAAFSPDGKTLFTTIDRLGRWDATTMRPLDPLDPADGHAAPAIGVRFSADGREVLSLDARKKFGRWAADGRLLEAGEAKAEPSAVPGDWGSVFQAGRVTMVFDRFPAILTIPEKAPDPAARFNRFPPPPLFVAPTADGRRHVTLVDDTVGDQRRFSVSGAELGPLGPVGVTLPWTREVPARPVSPCGRWVALGGKVYSAATGRVVLAPEAPGVAGRPARLATDSLRFERVWFSPDGRFLAGTLAWQDGTTQGTCLVAVWELASGRAFPVVPINAYHDAAVSPGGRTLVDGGIHGIVLRDLFAGTAVRLARRDLSTGYDYRQSQPIGFHPAGRSFVTGHADGSVIEWAVPHAARAAEAPAADATWADLAAPELRTARAAVERLVDHPATADAILGARFTPPAGPAPAGAKGADLEGPVSGDLLRGVRAIEVLERTGTPAARRLLAGWRDQGHHPRLAAEAAFALGRLGPVGDQVGR